MPVPLSCLRARQSTSLPSSLSLGDELADRLDQSNIDTLLDCLCATHDPAILSPDTHTETLKHDTLRSFVSTFSLPCPSRHTPLGRNDRVAVVLPTGPVNGVAILAVAAYHTCAPFNSSCTASELKEDVVRLNVKAVITTSDSVQRLELEDLHRELGCDIITVKPLSSRPAGLFELSLFGEDEYHAPRSPSALHTLDDRSLVLHTSGTSGKKKAVPYTLRSLLVGTWAVVESWDLRATDVNMNMMPLFHVGGIVRNLLAPVLSGGSTIVCSGFDPIAFWTIAADLGATWYYAAPTIHHAILCSQPDHIDATKHVRIRMICNAAGGLLPSLALDLKKRFPLAVVLPSYGMTECMPIASPPTTYQLDRPGCSGIACGPYLSIRDPSNLELELPRGKTGAVSVRGLPTFAGYEVSPDISVPLDTSAFTSEGWFDSGDMGYMDNDGYLFITGRSKEIINKGGEVISPFEVEEAVVNATKGRVKTSLAFSVEHDVLQETIGVVVVHASGQPRIGLLQLHDMLKDHLHPSKWPFAIVYMDDVPKNSAGKPLRIKLGQRLGLGCLSDSVRVLDRHYEADVPDSQASLSESIRCNRVEVNINTVETCLARMEGVADVAARVRNDGHLEAYVSIKEGQNLDEYSLRSSLGRHLHGYAIPELHILLQCQVLRNTGGSVDFEAMQRDLDLQRSHKMTSQERAVREIIAGLLSIEPNVISLESDFFLLGGNSLLLGRLSYEIRKQLGVKIPVTSIFTNSTISGISSLIAKVDDASITESTPYSSSDYSSSSALLLARSTDPSSGRRGQNHPLVMIIQTIPFVFFNQLKSAFGCTLFLYFLSLLTPLVNGSFWERVTGLVCILFAGRIIVRIVAPCTAILFKWVVIGRYRPGTYPMWSNYYLRWWIVNQSILIAGRGIFGAHPSLEILYYRLLGAKIGDNVKIDEHALLGEFDLITIHNDCRIDKALIRGFCVERGGCFRLAPIVLGRGAVVNTYTQISPGSTIAEGSVYGPHSSSLEPPSPPQHAAYNKQSIPVLHWFLQVAVAWPIIVVITFISYIPWFTVLWLMYDLTIVNDSLDPLASVVLWFASPERIALHFLARTVKAVVTPLLQLILGVLVKRVLGLNKPCQEGEGSVPQMVLLRRFVNSHLLSARKLKSSFAILGTHYEVVSVVYRMMGAKIGRQVYWPGSGVWCQDPELLEIGDNVVFGSRSEIFTTDALGSMKVTIGDGAMIADRVVLLPGVSVGPRAVLGSGTLTSRGKRYPAGSTWIGSAGGEACCLNEGSPELEKEGGKTSTPFGRAFYEGKAPYFVFPYPMILAISILFVIVCAIYWSAPAIFAVQVLKVLYLRFPQLRLLQSRWYEIGILYGVVAACFVVIVTLQGTLAVAWVLATKWGVIGERRPGEYDWDKSDYCQRWQLHLIFMKLMSGYGRGGVMIPMTGTTYIAWFYRMLGAKIGRNCSIFAGGIPGLMTEPDLVELGDDVTLDNCSVVAHINSRGNFSLNQLKISHGCAMRSGSRLLSGASMEDDSMLCEHTLLTSGEVADSGTVYVGWPASQS
ncbi:putative NRPS-like protein biosynthetic cluster [Marasmius tenuissimus]|nr:putative NRPS-like protein biosynthetic cluster [Marasmius tenuissimus]